MLDKITVRFGLLFFVVLFLETNIWFSTYSYSDIFLWAPGAAVLGHGAMLDLWGQLPPHPGSTFLFSSAFLVFIGISPDTATQIVMLFFTTILVTISSYLCFLLRPAKQWWLLIAVVLINKDTLDMTPPTALAALLSVVFVLLVFLIRENPKDSRLLTLAGVCGGFLLATRLDTGVMLLFVSLPYLWLLSRRNAFITAGFAALYFLALDPFLWVNPFSHISAIVEQAYVNHLTAFSFHYNHASLRLAFLAVFFAVVYTYIRPRLTSLPHDFLLWLLAGSSAICGALLISPYHPARYFFPLVVLWEAFLPLFVLELFAALPAFPRWVPLSKEFIVFLMLFLYRLPPILFIVVINLVQHR